jgi:hypothetical protein
VAVTGISGVPTSGTAGTPLTLTGTVAPDNATNKTIVWTVKSAGTTGATISGNTLSAAASGTVTVTATIANGKTASTPYTQDFSITIRAGGGVAPGGTYIITGSGGSLAATNSGAIIGTGFIIKEVINAIRTRAAGKDLTIQFGNGTATLDTGDGFGVEFDNIGGTWGLITLTGKITTPMGIGIYDSVSVTSKADINASVGISSGGSLTISGGTVSATFGLTVINFGTVNITGGTVSATSGCAVYIDYGTITVSGKAKLTSKNTDTGKGTIYNYNGQLKITGGTVENTSTTTGNAVYNDHYGVVSITGGTVSKAGDGNYAV